jgi:excinuclease ABC subunit A
LNVITGPSGAGKSTLIRYGLEAALNKAKETSLTHHFDENLELKIGQWKHIRLPNNFFECTELINVDQKAMHQSISSVPATVLGLMDVLRKKFSETKEAKNKKYCLSDFSFNGLGGCLMCQGKGMIQDDLFFLGKVEKICPECDGTRYQHKVQEITWNKKNLPQWLSTSIEECLFLLKSERQFQKVLSLCCRMGLGPLPLGIPTSSLSGGEAQRLRICAALSKSNKKIFCLLDEPTRGLSENDIGNLLESIFCLCQEGHTFTVVEHHELFQKYSQNLIVLGPKSGTHGGNIVERIVMISGS